MAAFIVIPHAPPSTGQIGDGVADQVIGADQSAINIDHRIVRGDDHDDRGYLAHKR